MWIMGNDEESCRYFRQADRVSAEYAVRDGIRIFQPDPDPVISLADEQSVAEVWVSGPGDGGSPGAGRSSGRKQPPFCSGANGGPGTGNRKLRRASSLDQIGLKKMELTVEGKKRFWYIYGTVSLQTESGAKTPSGNRPARDLYLRRIFCPEFRMAQSSGGPGGFLWFTPNGYMHLYGECMCATPAWAGAGMKIAGRLG